MKNNTTIKTVAKISAETAEMLGLDFKDKDDNYVVSMNIAQCLDADKFVCIPANCDLSDLPVIPTKPIFP